MRSRSRPEPCATRRLASAVRTSSAAPAATIASTRASMRVVQLVAVHGQAEQRGLAVAAPRSTGPRWKGAERSRASRAPSGGRCACRRSGGPPPRAPRESSACRAPRPARGQIRLDVGPDVGGYRRAHLELGQRRSQVEAGAADDDRAAPRVEQAIDLGVRQLGEAPSRELLGWVTQAEQPVFEAVPLLGASRRR